MNGNNGNAVEPKNNRTLKIIEYLWLIFIIGAGIVLLFLSLSSNITIARDYEGSLFLAFVVMMIAFLAEYMDSSLGMGYGTVLTPVLMILGFSPLKVVPCLLLSETITGIFAGSMHHKIGNVDLGRGSSSRKVMLILAFCSIVGTFAGVQLALDLPAFYVKLYIGIMISVIGVFLLVGRHILGDYSPYKIVGLGVWAAFNKAISGGGYGPLVTGGQVLLGIAEKSAVAITSFAEGLVCLFGLALYFYFREGAISWHLAVPLVIGAAFSVPASTWTVKVLPSSLLRKSMGIVTLYLGALCLLNVLIKHYAG